MSDEPLDILIVEDDSHTADILRLTLESEGYHVRVEPDGVGALEALRRAKPDVLLLDLSLPGVDGYDLCTHVRRYRPADRYLPILMVTALDTRRHKLLGFARGADDYITKPFDLDEVVARVRVWARASASDRGAQ